MKLKQINQNLSEQLSQGLLSSSASSYNHLYNTMSGHDFGSREVGSTSSPSGIPHNPRHRAFLGLEKRHGAIRL